MNRATKTLAVVVTAEAIYHALTWAWRAVRYQREATAPPATKPADCCCPDCRRPNVTISGREFSGAMRLVEQQRKGR